MTKAKSKASTATLTRPKTAKPKTKKTKVTAVKKSPVKVKPIAAKAPRKAAPKNPATAVTSPIDVVFSFDDTGSMSPCIAQVRRVVDETTRQLFRDIPHLRIGIIIHGDYCDGPQPVSVLDLTDNQNAISRFIHERRRYGGGDLPECYEQVLHDARSLAWKAGHHKALVMIGDNVPHPPHYPMNRLKLDWRNELKLLLEAQVHVYGVQALGYREADNFYQEIAETTGGFHLRLEQFAQVPELLKAICYQQAGQIASYESIISIKPIPGVTTAPSFLRNLDTLAGRTPKPRKVGKSTFNPVPSWRFQIIPVDTESPIRDFVQSQGLEFKKGNGYYEFTKAEDVQDYKEVIIQDRESEEFFTSRDARLMLGLPEVGTVRIRPDKGSPYRFFIQSTSVNRKLKPGTNFLYEVDTSR